MAMSDGRSVARTAVNRSRGSAVARIDRSKSASGSGAPGSSIAAGLVALSWDRKRRLRPTIVLVRRSRCGRASQLVLPQIPYEDLFIVPAGVFLHLDRRIALGAFDD